MDLTVSDAAITGVFGGAGQSRLGVSDLNLNLRSRVLWFDQITPSPSREM
jgi:hypothetical protein